MSIPKVVHFLWMSETKDERTEQCLASWRKHLVGYEIREWNGTSFPYNSFVWAREAVQVKSWAYVTDYFRLWVLYNYGGIYLDADVILQGNFDAYLDCGMFIATEFTSQLGPHCIGAEKGNSYLKECLEFYQDRHFIQTDGSLMILPLPRVMTYILMKRYGYTGSLANFQASPIVLGGELYVFPDNFFTIDIADGRNVGVHLGLGSWRIGKWHDSQPIYEEVIQDYFLKRFYLYRFNRGSKLRTLLYAILPNFIIVIYYKYKLKIKNIKTISEVRYLYE